MIIETRSILMPDNMVFTPHNFDEIAKEFKAKYKEETNERFKGNIYFAMTIGIISNKKIPDIDDCLLLIRGGNNLCDISTAEKIYLGFIKAYPKRGTIGCFCDMCRILNQDLPFADQFGDMIESLEDSINEYLDNIKKRNELRKVINKALSNIDVNDIKNGKANIGDILKSIVPNNENEDIDKEEVTENKEEVTENKEEVTENKEEVTEEPEVKTEVETKVTE